VSFLSGIGRRARTAFAKARPALQVAARAAAAYYTGGASEQMLALYNQSKMAVEDFVPPDLAEQAANKYPGVAALVNTYRDLPPLPRERAARPQVTEIFAEEDFDDEALEELGDEDEDEEE